MEIHLSRAPNGQGVVFATDSDRQAWQALPVGVELAITVRHPRNPKFHRWTRALITTLTANWPGEYRPTEAEVMRWLKIYTGLFDMVTDLETGAKVPALRSTSFDSMSQEDYAEWWVGLALPTCAAKLGITTEQLVDELGIAKAELVTVDNLFRSSHGQAKIGKAYKLRLDASGSPNASEGTAAGSGTAAPGL
jgi:hypothetical protein